MRRCCETRSLVYTDVNLSLSLPVHAPSHYVCLRISQRLSVPLPYSIITTNASHFGVHLPHEDQYCIVSPGAPYTAILSVNVCSLHDERWQEYIKVCLMEKRIREIFSLYQLCLRCNCSLSYFHYYVQKQFYVTGALPLDSVQQTVSLLHLFALQA